MKKLFLALLSRYAPHSTSRALLRCGYLASLLCLTLLTAYVQAEEAESPIVGDITRELNEQRLAEIRGVNYLRPTGFDPDICPDLQFGQDSRCLWDIDAIAADMARFQTLGVNTIRIFLNYYTFGGASKTDPNYDVSEAFAHLDAFIDVAQDHNIQVLPVLLSKYPQDRFGQEHLETTLRVHVRPVLNFLKDKEGIVAWDLFNEPDIGSPVDERCWDWANADYELCFPMANERLYFLRAVRNEVRLFDVERPITIGMAFGKSYFQPAGTDFYAADLVEFYSFHYYDNDPYDSGRYAEHWYYGQGFPADLTRAIDELYALNLNKPIVITELGFPTGPGHIRTHEEFRRDLAIAYQIAHFDKASGIVLWPFQREPEELVGDLFSRVPE
ncbi:MAG: cellulase family glycosylhydrolase [Chloroflexaceae bacterium]|nr:cellulase family glycosylhydrolase [Chloroflexaceae bacterium]NJO04231.1 cellulase family glycosylhydrolase [Chloroflexaceae bacterium]